MLVEDALTGSRVRAQPLQEIAEEMAASVDEKAAVGVHGVAILQH